MSMFTLAISCLTTSNLPWFIDLTFQVLMHCRSALDFPSITNHIHNWVLFLLWLHLFILSGVISPLFSSSILGTYRPGEFIFQYPIFFFLFLLFIGSVRDWPRLAHECSGISSGGLVAWWPAAGSGYWVWQWVRLGPLEGDHHYVLYFHHSLASGQTTGEEHSPTHQQKIGLKVYWECPTPIRKT